MKKRHVIYLALLALLALSFFGGSLKPVFPTVQLPGEVLIPFDSGGFFGGGLTNTFVATLLMWIIMVILAVTMRARIPSGDQIPSGFYNFFEMVIEGAYNFAQNIAGSWTKNFFPFFMTFVLMILIANWMELIPGVDSIGKWEDLGHHRVELAEEEAEARGEQLTEEQIQAIEEEALEDGGKRVLGIFLLRPQEGEPAGQQIVPYFRAAATDLNFTVALALISVIFTEYYGLRALGLGYLKKFFNYSEKKVVRNPLGLMDPLVGILELVSEISRILSFAFRLFGNVFAGQVLLFVIAFLLPVANIAVFGLEFFVGAIQALVFALLTLNFMAQATTAHHGEEEHH